MELSNIISYILPFIESMSSEVSFIYLFYLFYGRKCPWKRIFLLAAVLVVLVIPLSLIMNWSFLWLGQISYHGINILGNIVYFLVVERKHDRREMALYVIFSYFIWAIFYMLFIGITESFVNLAIAAYGIGLRVFLIVIFIDVFINSALIVFATLIERKYNVHLILERVIRRIRSWVIVILCMIVATLVLSITDIINYIGFSIWISTSIICLIFVLILVSFLHQIRARMFQEEKGKMQAELLGQQEMYIQELESIQSSMRSFRHDYKNMMSSLYLQSREGNIEEIEKNIHGLIDDFDENIDRKMNLTVQMANIQISEVKSLLYKKITEIQKKGIDFRMEVMYPVEETGMKPLDLSRVLGILLDNAIEAVEQVKGDISLVISAQADGVHIILDNTADQDVDISKIYEDGYSTKGSGRGTGLYSLREITANYENVNLMTECTNLRFIQRIDILNKSDKKIK